MMNEKEINNVLKLSALKRYKYFINKAADKSYIWSLYNDGWALAGDKEGRNIIPFWPTKEYASICATKEWSNYIPEAIEIHDFLDSYLNELEENKIFPAIFYTPQDVGMVVSHQDLKKDLKQELSRIE